MTFVIRPMTASDYAALAQFYSAAGEPTTAESLRYTDEIRESYLLYGRLLAETDGKIVGTSRYKQHAGTYRPGHFEVKLLVLPQHRSRGIGTALWRALMQLLAPHSPLSLAASVRETETAGLAYAHRLGFVERMRQWESRLDLTTVDLELHTPALDRVAAAGYEIITFADLAGDPVRNREAYELLNEVRRDVPSAEPRTDIPWERWQRNQSGPSFWAEGFFFARKGEELAGMSQLWRTDEPGLARTGITAVRRAHRGKGVATALKVRALQTARDAGYSKVATMNETNNREMLAINEKLGFCRQPAWISMGLELNSPRG